MKRYTVFLVVLFATPAFPTPPPPGPHIVDLPCRYVDVQPLVEYYVAKTVGEQTKTKVDATLSRFVQKINQDGSVDCDARIDVGDDTDWDDVGWAHYKVIGIPQFSVAVSFLFNSPHPGYTLPDKKHPEVLDLKSLAEMNARRPYQAPKQDPSHPALSIVQFEVLPEARQKLLNTGWKPQKILTEEDDNPNDASYVRAGYIELDGCYMDTDICVLHYTDKKGNCLTIYSEGYDPKDAFVNSWNFKCVKS